MGGPLSKLCLTPPFSINFRCQIENQLSNYRLLVLVLVLVFAHYQLSLNISYKITFFQKFILKSIHVWNIFFYLNQWEQSITCSVNLTTPTSSTSSDFWNIYNKSQVWVMVFNATFNNISVISWRSLLLVEETEVPGENQIMLYQAVKEIGTGPCPINLPAFR